MLIRHLYKVISHHVPGCHRAEFKETIQQTKMNKSNMILKKTFSSRAHSNVHKMSWELLEKYRRSRNKYSKDKLFPINKQKNKKKLKAFIIMFSVINFSYKKYLQINDQRVIKCYHSSIRPSNKRKFLLFFF